jgi:RNA polymerase sigma-70 factor (ECF subfamily)
MLEVKAGETQKLGLLYERHKKALYGFFYKMCRSSSTSEDLVQTVFIKILKSKHTFIGDGKFTTWMYHIARNALHDHYRKNKKQLLNVVEEKADQVPSEIDVENQFDTEQTINQLFEAIDLLSNEKRELLIMSRFENIKYKEIGEIMGCSEGAIKMKIRRTLIELRDIFNRIESGETHVA